MFVVVLALDISFLKDLLRMCEKLKALIAELHSDMTDAEFERKKEEIYEVLDTI